jgi:hypothetical protein
MNKFSTCYIIIRWAMRLLISLCGTNTEEMASLQTSFNLPLPQHTDARQAILIQCVGCTFDNIIPGLQVHSTSSSQAEKQMHEKLKILFRTHIFPTFIFITWIVWHHLWQYSVKILYNKGIYLNFWKVIYTTILTILTF